MSKPSGAGEQDAQTSSGETAPSGSGGTDTGADASSSPDGGEQDNITGPEFSFYIGSMMLTLRQSDIEDELAAIQLTKISDDTQVLGPDSDTFNGSYLRTVAFEGFEMDLFAPKDNPDACLDHANDGNKQRGRHLDVSRYKSRRYRRNSARQISAGRADR
jgi:hypothetical protein